MSVDPNYYFNTGGQGGLTSGQGGLTSGLGRCGLGGVNQNAVENFDFGDNNQVFITVIYKKKYFYVKIIKTLRKFRPILLQKIMCF